MSIVRNGAGSALFQVGKNCVLESTITAGNSPITVAVDTTIGSSTSPIVGNRGYISNDDGSSSILVKINHSDSTTTAFTLRHGEVFDLTGWDIHNIILTRVVADCVFRINVW